MQGCNNMTALHKIQNVCCNTEICCIFAHGNIDHLYFFQKSKKVSNVFQKTTSYITITHETDD